MSAPDFVTNLLAAGVARGTPLLFATLGEILAERSGVFNLGLEGMMLLGAMSGYGVAYATGEPWVGVLAGRLVGMMGIEVMHPQEEGRLTGQGGQGQLRGGVGRGL